MTLHRLNYIAELKVLKELAKADDALHKQRFRT